MFYRKEAKLLARQLNQSGLFQAEPSNLQGLKGTYCLIVYSKQANRAQCVVNHREFKQAVPKEYQAIEAAKQAREEAAKEQSKQVKSKLLTVMAVAAALSPDSFFEEFKEL